MDSSTSSSEARRSTPPLVLLALLLRIGGPAAIVAFGLIGASAILHRVHPHPAPPIWMEEVVVSEQMNRAATMPDADVMITGDSSALMDVDARLLSRELGGMRVESLATLAGVGPVGYARLLEQHTRAGHRLRTLVILLNPVSININDGDFARAQNEDRVLGRQRRETTDFLRSAKDEVHATCIAPFEAALLPGAYGNYYGSAAMLASRLREWHGTLIDPNRYSPAADISRDYAFSISPDVRRRLVVMGEVIHRLAPQVVWFDLTPIPEARVGPHTQESRSSTLAHTLESLGLDAERGLSLPSVLPSKAFATFAHLNAHGRSIYTRLLSDTLRRRQPASLSERGASR